MPFYITVMVLCQILKVNLKPSNKYSCVEFKKNWEDADAKPQGSANQGMEGKQY